MINKITNKDKNLHVINDKTAVFHANDMVTSGKRYIVSRMCGNTNNNDIYDHITDLEIEFHVTISRFVNNLTRNQQKLFGNVMEFVNKLYVKKQIVPVTNLPEHYNGIRRMYIDGDYSLAKHLPIPEVLMMNEHSYVSIFDVIADFLLRENDIIDDISNYNIIVESNVIGNDMHIFKSEKIKEIIIDANQRLQTLGNVTNSIVPIFLTFWSDDFDPNKSIKNNRQSVWIKTMTVFTIDKFGTKRSSTYPLTLSLKGKNHEEVENYYMNQIMCLKTGNFVKMYSRSHKNLVCVHADLFSIMNDQPERRGNLNLANGNSMIHGRFGILLDCKQVHEGIRSCTQCSIEIIKEATSMSNGK